MMLGEPGIAKIAAYSCFPASLWILPSFTAIPSSTGINAHFMGSGKKPFWSGGFLTLFKRSLSQPSEECQVELFLVLCDQFQIVLKSPELGCSSPRLRGNPSNEKGIPFHDRWSNKFTLLISCLTVQPKGTCSCSTVCGSITPVLLQDFAPLVGIYSVNILVEQYYICPWKCLCNGKK